MRGFGLAGAFLVLMSSIAQAQNCPAPTGNPGWLVEVHHQNARTGGLMPDPPISVTTARGFPIRLGEVSGLREASELYKLTFSGDFQVCQPGRYEFTLMIEAGQRGNLRHILCDGYLEKDRDRLFNLDRPGYSSMIEPGRTKSYTGATQLEPGSAPLTLVLSCGTQRHGGTTSVRQRKPDETLLGTAVALRVRGPGDDAPRDIQVTVRKR